MVLNETGKSSITKITGVRHFNGYSMLNIVLKTGRKHQIRAHMASLGFPLAGDTLYGGAETVETSTGKQPVEWPLLHSCRIILPGKINSENKLTSPKIELVCPLPSLFSKIIQTLTIWIVALLLPLAVNGASAENLYRNSLGDVLWKIPPQWKKSPPPKTQKGNDTTETQAASVAAQCERGWFSFGNGGGQLLVTCEPSPAKDSDSLLLILQQMIKEGKMKIDSPPFKTNCNGYIAVKIVSPPQTDHPLDVGRIFVYFTGLGRRYHLNWQCHR